MKAIKAKLCERGHRITDERRSRLFAEVARPLLTALARGLSPAARILLAHAEQVLLSEATDPNAGRRLLVSHVETRSQFELRYARRAA